ncbi:hypothetical protein KIN34_11080 [Cellulomonas sp. DKR-3]|uniref:Integral membrane protein n=1 Tax=Cellulomonas fulva TaxID=2835530 RepID=A0ABS5U077_9CELL|nr:hypothetical protein [Cellulomonas fulva]
MRAAPAAAPATAPVAVVAPPRRRRWGRSTTAVVLILLGALLAPIAVVSAWAQGLVDDTDRWVATVGPLSDDTTIQAAVTNRITDAIVDAVNVEQLAADATGAVADLGLPPLVSSAVESLQGPLVNAATDFIRRGVTNVVTSDAFSTAWVEANRTAHAQLVAVLQGDPDAIASIDADGTLSVKLTTVIDAVKDTLVERGFTIVERLPSIDATFPLVQSSDLVKLQTGYRLLHALGTWLPWLSILLLAGGVIAAQRRSRALVVAGLSLAVAMLVLGLGLTIGRSVYASSLPDTIQRHDAALVVYDQAVSLLRIALRSGLVLGLVVAAVAFLVGGTVAARSLRSSWSRATAAARGAGDRRGVSTGPVGEFLYQQRTLLRVVVIAIAALVIVLADPITPPLVFWTAVVAGAVLLLLSLLARPGAPVVEPDEKTVAV